MDSHPGAYAGSAAWTPGPAWLSLSDMAKQRLVTGGALPGEEPLSGSSPVAPAKTEPAAGPSLRPTTLGDYVGQPKLIEKLAITLQAVRERGEPMEHVLLHGPPGLGKTTLAHLIAQRMGTHLTITSGPALTRPTDLVGTLTRLQRGDVLFIDEVHRLSPVVEEYIYPAMEDFRIDITLDSGLHARTVSMPLQPFTLIGATTRAGLLSGPMRSRFGLVHNFDFYSEEELLTILKRSAALLGVLGEGGDAGALSALRALATRSRGTPRIANRLLRRVRDFAQVRGDGRLSPSLVDEALLLEGIDALGLDELDRKYLRTIAGVYAGGPVGLEAVAATLGEDAGTLEDVVEPYLLQLGFVARTRKGRQLTRRAAEHLGIAWGAAEAAEGGLFDADEAGAAD